MVVQKLTGGIGLTEMREINRTLSEQCAQMEAPKSATQQIDELSDSQQACVYAPVLPCLAGLAEKMPLDKFQSH